MGSSVETLVARPRLYLLARNGAVKIKNLIAKNEVNVIGNKILAIPRRDIYVDRMRILYEFGNRNNIKILRKCFCENLCNLVVTKRAI